MTKISFDEMKSTVKQAFLNAGLHEKQADICAQIHTETSCDGIFSHGLNRVARFVDYVNKGWVDINANPERVKSLASLDSPRNAQLSLPKNMALGLWACVIRRTGCVVALTVGKLHSKAMRQYVGLTPNPVCQPGVREIPALAITRS